MKFLIITRGVNSFTVFLILLCGCLVFIILPTQYLLYMKTRDGRCSDQVYNSVFRGMRNFMDLSTDEKIQERLFNSKKAGTPDESTIFVVPRHKQPPFVPYIKVVNRNKFDALFRDHGSSNPLPTGLTEDDKLVIYKEPDRHNSPWEQFYQDINRYQLYSFNNTHEMTSLMTYLQDSTMSLCPQMGGGTQIKLNITFTDGGKALMKPWRVPREYQTLVDHYFFADIERHTAELAAFHLDRILDFRRVPPTTGRIFNITSEIRACASGKVFVKSFFKSPANNTCFITECHQYCEISKTPVCGKPDLVEGSVAAFLPQDREYRRRNLMNPWKRSYTRGTGKAKWETNSSYCYSSVMVNPPFTKGRRMLDIIDLSIFDFFIDMVVWMEPILTGYPLDSFPGVWITLGNFDRHTYNTFFKFGEFTTIIHLDQGRSFGSYEKDELTCLAALKQCCFVRNSTYHRLLLLNKDEYKLGDVMRESMSTDPIAPVLYEPHYEALNRRLRIIIDVIEGCLATASAADDVLKKEPRYEDYMREISQYKNQQG